MITELNTLPLLSPAFNKNLLGVSSDEIFQEKYSYILDILLDEFLGTYLQDAVNGYPANAGYVLITGVQGAEQYTVGDKVMVFDNTNGVYTGVHRVRTVPNQTAIILDTVFVGSAISLGEIWVYKLKRNKLPSNPEGNAVFNVNSFGAGEVGLHYKVSDSGMFNIAENFKRYKYLAHEEYYLPITYTAIASYTFAGFGLVGRVLGASYLPSIGEVIVITQTSGTDYNGTWTVLELIGTDSFSFSANYIGFVGGGSINRLPKTVSSTEDYANISEEGFAFNGALPYPQILGFNEVDYDASLTQPCKFLTTIPNDTKVRINDKGYIQFFQSDRLSCTSYVIDVYDELAVLHQYVVNLAFQNETDNMQGVSIGAGDLNAIPLDQFETVPARGLPVIQECDDNYEVYLKGSTGCAAGGVQNLMFEHPLSNGTFLNSNMLENNWWLQNLFDDMTIDVTVFEINNLAQTISNNPQGAYNRATVTAQNNENLYSDAIELMTGLTMENPTTIQSQNLFLINGQPNRIEIDLDVNFRLESTITMSRSVAGFVLSPLIFTSRITWNATTCEWRYSVSGINKAGFQGLQGGTGVSPTIELSEHKKFKLDWSCCGYTGARLIFQDRLGSMAGFNFTLKKFNTLNISSDAYEQDKTDVNRNAQSRGFSSIQSSYDETVSINSDFITQSEYDYLEEALTNPNCFLQVEGEVFPATIIPESLKLLNKENDNLIRISLSVKVNGTNYSQRN